MEAVHHGTASSRDFPSARKRWPVVAGEGIFRNDGEALEIAGPAALLLALLVMSVIAIMVMEGLSEFTQLFPAPNAIVEYVRTFVDPDLAWVAGIAYW